MPSLWSHLQRSRPRSASSPSARAGAWFATIRGQILLAFLAMSAITAGLGGYATSGIRDADQLISDMFDQSLMSVSYARAAAADLASMQAHLTRRWLSHDVPDVQELDKTIEALNSSLEEDLEIATERSQSARAKKAADGARAAIQTWQSARRQLANEPQDSALWRTLERSQSAAAAKIELLINYTAGDGFVFRQRAKTIVATDEQLSLVATGLAVLFSASVVWLLARRITRPVAAASAAAERIAGGDLNGAIPRGGADELGDLLRAMGLMRDKIRAMMDQEIAQRRSAETRLADALQSSQEGFVLLDADDQVVMANAQAAELLGDAGATQGLPSVAAMTNARGVNEVQIRGRWLRMSRSAARDGGSVLVCTDLTRLKENEVRLQSSLSWLDAALASMVQGLCLCDAEGRLQVVNNRFSEIFEVPPEQIGPGLAFRDVLQMSPVLQKTGSQFAANAILDQPASEASVNRTHLMELENGRVLAVCCRKIVAGGWVATFEDVTEARLAQAKIIHMARHDALTNLPNRTLLAERIEQALAQMGRDGGHCSVLYLDLDRFKNVNDTLGHPMGDALLRAVADRLQACVREVDTVARLGGDEFAILQSGLGASDNAAILARRVVEVLGVPFDLDGNRVVISTSVGISVAPQDGKVWDKLLKNADMALYKAKAEGRATWRFFEPGMDARMQARRVLETDLRKALADDKLELHFQPLFDLGQARVSAFEALLRWRHPSRGMVSPGEFVPVAEEIGLIVPLGEWVIKQACRVAAGWPEHVRIAVNVSPAQFASGRLIQTVTEALASSGLAVNRLELEITESVLLSDNAATLATLHAIRQLGVRISMDDFGTGYSSLSYLRSFPFDKIKIDQSFVRDLGSTEDADIIVRTIILLGHNLGMRVTAEGVETKEQLAWLSAEGCNEVQGYLFSPAIPPSEAEALLAADIQPAIAA